MTSNRPFLQLHEERVLKLGGRLETSFRMFV